MSYRYHRFEVSEGIARVTLDRPEAANAMDLDSSRELMDISIACDERDDVRVVVIGASGKIFCAGGNLKSFEAFGPDIGPRLKEMTVYLHAAISRFARMDAPLVTAVGGMAAGAGMSLAICGDLVVASQSAQFTMAYTAAGLSPDGSSSYYLPRLVGLRRAQELMLTNRRLGAAEALEWGLVTRVVPDAELEAEVDRLARGLAAGPTAAYGSVKRLLAATFDTGLESQMDLEAREIVDNARGADGAAGIRAFVAKARPEFGGRR
jgi:2-(1,2-epoxy-1,2-dihydrophenyl)acetyl-CoA isomerase